MKQFFKNKLGTTSIEYAIISAGISVVIIVAAGFVGQESKENFDNVAGQLDTAFNPASGENNSN